MIELHLKKIAIVIVPGNFPAVFVSPLKISIAIYPAPENVYQVPGAAHALRIILSFAVPYTRCGSDPTYETSASTSDGPLTTPFPFVNSQRFLPSVWGNDGVCSPHTPTYGISGNSSPFIVSIPSPSTNLAVLS